MGDVTRVNSAYPNWLVNLMPASAKRNIDYANGGNNAGYAYGSVRTELNYESWQFQYYLNRLIANLGLLSTIIAVLK